MPRRPKDFDYQRYLASREWALLKEQVRERCDGWCEFCECFPYQETHHITYERIGHETLDDLLAVCSECHRWLSAKLEVSPFARHFLISERLLREANRTPLHLVYNLIAPEALPEDKRFNGIIWAHCRPHRATGNCAWCTGTLMSVEDFHWEVRLSRGEV